MYLPENDAQMFAILAELRVYAAMNELPRLAEHLDDTLVLLALGRLPGNALHSAPVARDSL